MQPEAVLRTYLAHLLLNNEFQLAFGSESMAQLSHLPAYPLIGTDKVGSGDIPGPKSLPPLSRLVFYLLTAKCPVFFIHGPEFIARLDTLIDAIFMDIVSKFIRATQFDLLACQDHVLTLLAHLNDDISAGSFLADTVYTAKDLWPWCQKVNYIRAFDVRGKIEAENLKDEKISSSRQEKFLAVAQSMGSLFAAIEFARKDLPDYWSIFKESPTVEELPEVYFAVFDGMVDATARVMDVVLVRS